LKLLRVLRTLFSIACADSFQLGRHDMAIPATLWEAESSSDIVDASSIISDLALDDLWDSLSACLSAVTNTCVSADKISSAPLLSSLLPCVEATFIVNSIDLRGSDKAVLAVAAGAAGATADASAAPPSAAATTSSSRESSSSSSSSAAACLQRQQSASAVLSEKFTAFLQRHQRPINLLVRENPSVIDGSLAPLLKCARLLDFDNKRAYFRKELRRQQDEMTHSGARITIRRPKVFEDSYNQLRKRTVEEMKGKLSVQFQAEEGIDAGGVTREWFLVLSREIFNQGYALFNKSVNSLTYMPNTCSYINHNHLSYFSFVGRIIGKAIYDGQLLDAYFTRSFYKHMLGLPVTYEDLEAVDAEFFKSLVWMLENDITGVFELNFSCEFDEVGVVKVWTRRPYPEIPTHLERRRPSTVVCRVLRCARSMLRVACCMLHGLSRCAT
jgi:E3 ubiquitin-protein ligase HUWE1